MWPWGPPPTKKGSTMTIANPGWSQVNGSEVEASPWIRNP